MWSAPIRSPVNPVRIPCTFSPDPHCTAPIQAVSVANPPMAAHSSWLVPVYLPRYAPFVIAPDGLSIPLPTAPDVEQEAHNRSFESEVDPPNPPKWSEYRRMLEFIFAKFPQSKGRNLPHNRHVPSLSGCFRSHRKLLLSLLLIF